MINLKNVTLLGVDCVNIDRLITAADMCEAFAEFGNTKLLTSIESEDKRTIKIDPITEKHDYDKFIMEKLNSHVDTEYVLVFQWDGFILNPNAWDDEYLKYDYIGAPWQNNEVGNGGFSLRSKKLLEECALLSKENDIEYGGVENQEDVLICHKYKIYLESRGMNFAPVELAKKFSIEGNQSNKRIWTHQFGFHDFNQTNVQLFVRPSAEDFKFTTFYKYSDKGKAPPVDKKSVFINFLESFSSQSLCVLLDNSTVDSYNFFKSYCPDKIWQTELGNAGAHVFLLDKAKELEDDQVIYFCEDDYIHAGGAKFLLHEALGEDLNGMTVADYATLYDHGDKYVNEGQNPFIKNGGEDTTVVITKNSHWKYTNSTTMTFAAKAKTIKEDYDILKKYCTSNSKEGRTNSFEMFQELSKDKGRKVVSSLPARSTHLCPYGMHSPFFPWQRILGLPPEAQAELAPPKEEETPSEGQETNTTS